MPRKIKNAGIGNSGRVPNRSFEGGNGGALVALTNRLHAEWRERQRPTSSNLPAPLRRF